MTATLRDPNADQITVLRQRVEDDDETGMEAGRADDDGQSPPGLPAENNQQTCHAAGQGSGQATGRPSRSSTNGKDLAGPGRAGPSLVGALVDVLPVLPTIGAIATVFAYIGVGDPLGITGTLHLWPLATGAVAAVGTGVLLAFCIRPYFTAPDQAHPQSFAELRQRLDGLASQLGILHGRKSTDLTASQQLALREAAAHQQALEHDLARGGPHWLVGTGYVDALTRLHRAEEALILVRPEEDVVAGALFDELRLDGSTIPDRVRLLGKLRAAIQALCPSAAPYLIQPTTEDQHRHPADPHTAPLDARDGPSGRVTASCKRQAAEARMVLQGVRRSINEFRDESRARLIRSRARLYGTMTVTGLITYVLLAFAIAVSPGPRTFGTDPIAAAAAVYLVGAVVGLFNRLYTESGDEAAGEDYGLSKTRLLLTPMLSGLAAVGGVMIVGMLSGVVDVNAFTPAAAVTPTPPLTIGLESAAGTDLPKGMPVRETMLSLADVFNLERYPFGLVLAAAFGLAPKSFLERLQKAGDQSRLDLQSTAANRQ
jgi:hypothetical protein